MYVVLSAQLETASESWEHAAKNPEFILWSACRITFSARRSRALHGLAKTYRMKKKLRTSSHWPVPAKTPSKFTATLSGLGLSIDPPPGDKIEIAKPLIKLAIL